MKSLSVALLFCFSSSLVLTAKVPNHQVENTALAECNATNPVQRNAITAIRLAYIAGERINLSHEEKCFTLCVLQKVHFLNENAEIKNGTGLVKFLLEKFPELVKYTDAVVSGTFLINRVNKGIEDKCEKAYVIFYEHLQNIATLSLAYILEQKFNVKEQVINNMSGSQQINKELPQEIATYLKSFDLAVSSAGQKALEEVNAGVGN